MLTTLASPRRLLNAPPISRQLLSIPTTLYNFHVHQHQQQPFPNSRHASLTSAIHRGIRRGSKGRSTNSRTSTRTNSEEQQQYTPSSSRSRRDGPSSKTSRGRGRQSFGADEPSPETGGMNQLRAFSRSGAKRGGRESQGWSGRGRQRDSDRADGARGKEIKEKKYRSSDDVRRSSDYQRRPSDRSERTQDRGLRDGGDRSGYRSSQEQRGGYQKRPYGRADAAQNDEGNRSGYRDPQERRGGYQKRPYGRSDAAQTEEGNRSGYRPKEGHQRNDYHRKPYARSEGDAPNQEIETEARQSRYQRNEDQKRAPFRSEETFSKSPQESQPASRNNKNTGPMPIPYTTAASQFLYGRSVVLAALRSQRRQIYKLYIIPEDDRGKTDSDDYMIMQLAKWGGIEIVRADRELLNKMSKGRPHNVGNLQGYVLDASPLPQPEINSLPVVDLEKGSFRTFLDEITPKPRGSSPSMQTQLNSTKKSSRFPFILWLNEIVDPENFGSIIRSAAFFGVDALITSNSSSAPLSAISIKASSGASEYMPLLRLSDQQKTKMEFMRQSHENHWKCYAAVVAPPHQNLESRSSLKTTRSRYLDVSYLRELDALKHHPVVLMLGSEGFGISPSLIRLANHEVGIPGGLGRPKSLDSLNVGVAAGVLCQAFLNGGGGGDGMRLEGGGVESQQQQQQREIDTDQNQDEELRLEQEEHQVQEVDQEQESAPEEIKEDEAEKEKEKDENDEKLF